MRYIVSALVLLLASAAWSAPSTTLIAVRVAAPEVLAFIVDQTEAPQRFNLSTATSSTNTTMTDTTAPFPSDLSITGGSLRIRGGTGIGQERNIDTYTTTELTLTRAWTTNPASGDQYEVIESAYLTLTLAAWTVDVSTSSSALSRWSIPYDGRELAGDTSATDHEVDVRHHVYFDLGTALVQDQAYAVVTPHGNTTFTYDEDVSICEAIKVNQEGYISEATTRFANFGVYLGGAGSRTYGTPPDYSVRLVSDSSIVKAAAALVFFRDDTAIAAPPATSSSIDYATSGEQVYRADLSSVAVGGPYYIVVAGCGRSEGDFYVRSKDSGSFAIVAKVAARGMYHQRCGIALETPFTTFTRDTCHELVYDVREPKLVVGSGVQITVVGDEPTFEIHGGHHDAGDFDRRDLHVRIAVAMLSFYEAWPDNFIDSQYNIPESGNGIPDWLDEAMWAVLSWENLQVPSGTDFGGVRAGTERLGHPAYGVDSAASESANASGTSRYGTFDVNTFVTSWAAGIFAHASRLIQPFDTARADILAARAKKAWEWLGDNGGTGACEAGYLYASLQLYLLTGTSSYHDVFRTVAANAVSTATCPFPESYISGHVGARTVEVTWMSYMLDTVPQATNASLRADMLAIFCAVVDSPNNHYHGDFIPGPHAYEHGAQHGMGFGQGGSAQGVQASAFMWAHRLNECADTQQNYFNVVSRLHDYALGLNPIGTSYIVGLGDVQPNSPLHLDSWYTKYGQNDGTSTEHHGGSVIGNVPGIVIYGPFGTRSGAVHEQAVNTKIFPTLPDSDAGDTENGIHRLRRWGGSWSMIAGNEFSTWETMIWIAVMYGFLHDADPTVSTGASISGGSVQ